jgi:hypothetical protein
MRMAFPDESRGCAYSNENYGFDAPFRMPRGAARQD